MRLWEVTAHAGDATYRGICTHNKMPNEREIAVCALHSFHHMPSHVEIKEITMDELRVAMRQDPHYGLVMCSMHCPLLRARTNRPLRLVVHPSQERAKAA